MWIYRGEELQRRLLLTSNAGFWLDYWLFLHNDDTHSLWCARPFGLQQLAVLARESTSRHDRALGGQLALELAAASRIVPYVSCVKSAPELEPHKGDQWSSAWLKWLEHVVEVAIPSVVVADLEYALAESLEHGDLWTATFLTRRIAAELAEEEWSKHVLLENAITAVLDNERLYGDAFDARAFASALHSSLSPSEPRLFTVTVAVTPLTLGKKERSRDREQPTLIFDDVSSDWPNVVAIRYTVSATHSEEAAARARERARAFIDLHRTRHYVAAHLIDNVTVEAAATATATVVPLPRPFWSTRPKVRKTPALFPERLRSDEHVSVEQRRRRQSARWHISRALADWAEDAHSAASHMWQALEAFAGTAEGGWRSVSRISDEYVQQAPHELSVYLARCIGAQRGAFHYDSNVCNWYVRPTDSFPIEHWLRHVFSPANRRSYLYWRPLAPELLFNERVGLLRLLQHAMTKGQAPKWMRERLGNDFGLLYAMRNRVVHRGERVLGSPAARYLARAAMEVLIRLIERETAEASLAQPNAG